MLSRVADNLYWFSRYVRRAENTARLVGVGSQLQLDMPRSVRFAWRPMIDTVGAGECFEQCHPDAGDAAGDVDVIRFLLLDERNPSSLRTSVDSAREILRGIRDTLPQDVWEAINDLHLYAHRLTAHRPTSRSGGPRPRRLTTTRAARLRSAAGSSRSRHWSGQPVHRRPVALGVRAQVAQVPAPRPHLRVVPVRIERAVQRPGGARSIVV